VIRIKICTAIFPLCIGLVFSLLAVADTRSDDYIAGYATAVVQRGFSLPAEIEVQSGTVRIAAPEAGDVERREIETLLGNIAGVNGVHWVATSEFSRDEAIGAVGNPGGEPPAPQEFVFLPERRLFAPLLADPRWPHFSASYQRYLGDEELRDVGSPTFGESFPMLQTSAPFEGRFELGLQAGVFSTFDFDSESFDLINSDFLGAITGTWARRNLSARVRFYHQSSHLGDEFLLRNSVERVNLSFEALDLLVSYDANEWLRLYGGGGLLVRSDPSDLNPGSLQFGVELSSPRTFLGGFARPVAAADVQLSGESDWEPDLSVRVGLQFESPRLRGRRLLFLLEYYDGRSPNGQFFERDIRYIGLGPHLFF